MAAHTHTTPGNASAVPPDTRPSRRDILAAAGFTGLTAVAAIGFARPEVISAQIAPISKADDHLIAMCAELDRLEHQYNSVADEDWDRAMAQLEAITSMQLPMLRRICTTPARTLAGVQAKARSIALWADDVLHCPADGDLVASLTASVLRDLVQEDV